MVKRGSERQITKDDCDEEEAPVQAGVFGKASDAQMNRRRIVKVKRQAATTNNDSSGPNPFAGIALTTTQPQKEATQPEKETTAASAPPQKPEMPEPANEAPTTASTPLTETPASVAPPQPVTESSAPTPPTTAGSGFAAFAHSASPFKQLVSGTAAFGGAGGFSGVATNGHQAAAFGGEARNWSTPGKKTLFSGETKQVSPAAAPMSSPKVTGEEEEETLFNHEATLFVMVGNEWKQRGKGDLRVNYSKESGGRLIMRQKVTLRLFLNAGIYGQMKVSKMGQSAVTFSCVNGADESLAAKEGEAKLEDRDAEKGNLRVYALRFLVKGEAGEHLIQEFEKAVEQSRKKADEKKGE